MGARSGRWAFALFRMRTPLGGPGPRHSLLEALPKVGDFLSPRAWAFVLLGLDAYCTTVTDNSRANAIRTALADGLVSLLEKVETSDWVWFENGLSYDSAGLCQALILTGTAMKRPDYLNAGLKACAGC